MQEQLTFGLDSFIERPGVESAETDKVLSTLQMFDALDRAVQKRQVVALIGPTGSGKKTLLAEWARKQTKVARPDEIIVISMSPQPSKSLSPICIALSRIWDVLEQLARPAYTQDRSSDARSIKMYNARQLESLRIAVQKSLCNRNIRAIVVVRSNLLDEEGLTWLLDMLNYYDLQEGFKPHFALILGCTSLTSDANPTLITYLKRAGELKQKGTRLTLPYIQPDEFALVMSQLVRLNLNAVFSKDLNLKEVATNWHKYTSGVWSLLRELALHVDEELGPAMDSKPRAITREVIDNIDNRFRKLQE